MAGDQNVTASSPVARGSHSVAMMSDASAWGRRGRTLAARPKRARRDHARLRDRTRISLARLPAHMGGSFAVEAVLRRDVDPIDVVLVASGRGNSAPGPLTTLRQEQRGNRGGSLPMSG